MRISQDDDSWKASGVKRRDFRSVKNGPEIPKRSGAKKKKDTKKWCRGKEGKAHIYVWMDMRWWVSQVCTTCGKHGKSHYLWGNRLSSAQLAKRLNEED